MGGCQDYGPFSGIHIKGDRDLGIDIDVDMDIESDMAVLAFHSSFKGRDLGIDV